MPTKATSVAKRLAVLLASLALFATACTGGGGSADPLAAAEADANATKLDLAGDIATTELLNAATGEISTISDVATGDRAILLWYWAPH